MELNDYISRAAANSEVSLPSGEFEGPLVINKPLRIKGKNTTIWAKKSPVIEIKSGGVSIEELRAEITEGSIEEPAVTAAVSAAARNVEVLGRVSGFGAEDGYFDIPRTIELGKFPADRENSFKLEVNVPAKTEIVCGMREVRLEPAVLQPGRNELKITLSGISAQMFLYAEVLFKSQFMRRVYITGRPDGAAEQAVMKSVYTAPQREQPAPLQEQAFSDAASPSSPQEATTSVTAQPQTEPQKVSDAAIETAARAIHEMMSGSADGSPKTDVINMAGRQVSAPPNAALPPLDMKRGQRVGLTQYLGDKFEVWFTANAPRGMEIDPYVFLLQSGDRAAGDEGLIFFGNERSANGEAKYFPADGHIEVDLSKIPPQIQKIALAYSIYDGGAAKNFRAVGSPRVSLRAGGERVTFTMTELSEETTVVALEFYLYKGEWKISAVGAGFKDGLAKLCNRYGIEVV